MMSPGDPDPIGRSGIGAGPGDARSPARTIAGDPTLRRVLYVAYQYPPVGGAGVQRTTKFVKYLPRHGWLPSVLTVANPSVPLFDESLAADVPEGVIVRRARTREPGYAVKEAVSVGPGRPSGLLRLCKGAALRLAKAALQPDAQVLWAPAAIREGLRILRERPHAAIVATGPPFSSFLIGATLARRTGLPLVLDYRDEWDISNAYWENRRVGLVSGRIQSWMQRRAVRRSRALVATTRSSARALGRIRDASGSRARVVWIYNGYDPDDFLRPAPAPVGPDGPYRLAYVGTLWNLTSVAPLVEAVRTLARDSPDLAASLELVFAGRKTGPQQQILGGLAGLPCPVVEHPYVDHSEAIDLIRSASGLCVLLSDLPGVSRVVPAKIFEYMAAGRPIVAIAPRGELWELLEGNPAAHRLEPGDVAGIADCLRGELRRHRAGEAAAIDGRAGRAHDRPGQAGQLAEILGSLA